MPRIDNFELFSKKKFAELLRGSLTHIFTFAFVTDLFSAFDEKAVEVSTERLPMFCCFYTGDN